MTTVRMPELKSLRFVDTLMANLERIAKGVSAEYPRRLSNDSIVAVTSCGEYIVLEKDRLFEAQEINPFVISHGIIVCREIDGVYWKGNWTDTVIEYNNRYTPYTIIAFVEI